VAEYGNSEGEKVKNRAENIWIEARKMKYMAMSLYFLMRGRRIIKPDDIIRFITDIRVDGFFLGRLTMNIFFHKNDCSIMLMVPEG
jgi:hypothetical protein